MAIVAVGVLVLGNKSSTPVPMVWKYPIPWLVGDAFAASTNDTVYVRTFGGELIAIDRNGRKQWTSPAGVWCDSEPIVGNDGTIYFRTILQRPLPSKSGPNSWRHALFAVRPDGSVKWRRAIDGIVSDEFALAIGGDGSVLFGNTNGYIGAINLDGTDAWSLSAGAIVGAPVTSAKGSLFFSGGPGLFRGPETVFCVDSNRRSLYSATGADWGWSKLSVDWDETVYVPGESNKTMRAFKADGSVKWTYATSSRAFSAPTIADDGSLYFTFNVSRENARLCALDHDGKKKWELPLGKHWSMKPPVIASDGTLFVVSSDPKVTAVNPDGTVKWVFRPPSHRLEVSRLIYWRDFKELWRKLFPDTQNSFVTSPVLTSQGVLYVGFGGPYNMLYALRVGVGPSTNSPWPMEGANAQRTRHVAEPRKVRKGTNQFNRE